MSLTETHQTNTGRPINKWAHYLPLYERHFAPFRNRSILFVEIGTGQGGSSEMFARYFGPCAQIVTLDIRPDCKAFENDQICVRIGDQSDEDFLKSVIDEFGAPDIVLDDGGHFMVQVKASFHYLFPRMTREGIYMVEDMHTAYWPECGGGLRKPGTFIEDMKDLVDEMNATNPYHPHQGAGPMPRSEIGAMVRGMHFYESMVVIERGRFIDKRERSIPKADGIIW